MPPAQTTPTPRHERDATPGWNIALAAAAAAERVAAANEQMSFALSDDGQLRPGHGEGAALIGWSPGTGWTSLLPADDPRHPLLDLYLPICSATIAKPLTVGHLGLSLDGFIATPSGESQWITGNENLRHVHRMRALSDAVVVGAGTVAADDPQLTTRLVPGVNPRRVVFDPARRLTAEYRVFRDDSAPTWYCCARSLIASGETHVGSARMIGFDDGDTGTMLAGLLRYLRSHGCPRVFVEGGGVTVSAFVEADLLDRLQMAFAPLIIGEGHPAIRVPARANLRDCRRPPYRVFRMGGDVLFDCDLSNREGREPTTDSNHKEHKEEGATPPIARII